MLIDWFTVIAQIFNFLLLVFLLKRFLWGRLVKAIDEREGRIATQISEAERKDQDAKRLAEEARAQVADFEQKRDGMIAQARAEAEAQRKEMLQKARDEAQRLETQWHEDLGREQKAFLEEVKRRGAAAMLAIIRRALADLASTDIQHCASRVFLDKLRALDVASVRDLLDQELAIVSPSDLPDDLRQELRLGVEGCFGKTVKLRFERVPSMAWGIELRGNGRRIGWSSDSYVESLEEGVRAALEHQAEVLLVER